MKELQALREREKELRCLYAVHEILRHPSASVTDVFNALLVAIPSGWQRPDTTKANIHYLGRSFGGPCHVTSRRSITSHFVVGGIPVGRIEVIGTPCVDHEDVAGQGAQQPFLPEEITLLETIASRVSEFLDRKHAELLGLATTSRHMHWQWRESVAAAVAESLASIPRFRGANVYLGGSAESGEAGPGSDIDLAIVFTESEELRHDLAVWLDGWDRCLVHMMQQQTGQVFAGGILNVQWLPERPEVHRRPDLRPLT